MYMCDQVVCGNCMHTKQITGQHLRMYMYEYFILATVLTF